MCRYKSPSVLVLTTLMLLNRKTFYASENRFQVSRLDSGVLGVILNEHQNHNPASRLLVAGICGARRLESPSRIIDPTDCGFIGTAFKELLRRIAKRISIQSGRGLFEQRRAPGAALADLYDLPDKHAVNTEQDCEDQTDCANNESLAEPDVLHHSHCSDHDAEYRDCDDHQRPDRRLDALFKRL
jgi:hypothetical protein